MSELVGVCVPVCTPFDATGEQTDEAALRDHIDAMIESGVHIVLVCGGTGEFAYLRQAEKRRIVEIASMHIDGRIQFMVQTSAINTADTIENTMHAFDHGADACMILPPYFEGPDMEGVYQHYAAIAAAVDVPIMVYNIPQHSGIDIQPAFFKRLLEIDQIRYIKDSTGDLIRIQELLGTGGTVFNGGDPITFQALVAGCPGCVWGAVNAMPREAVRLFDLVQTGRLNEANALWKRMLPSQLYFWSHVYNATVKAATRLAGRDLGPCRAPVQPLTDAALVELKAALAPLDIGTTPTQIAV